MIPRIEKFADLGTEEPFVARTGPGLIEILNATSFKNREKINAALLSILFEALMPAFLSLREVLDMESGKTEKMILNLEKGYSNLYDHLWVGYKDRMPKAVALLGFEIGFLFKSEKDFEKGMSRFLQENSGIIGLDSRFAEMLRDERATWQNMLGSIRNDYIQHKKIDSKDVRVLFNPEAAERVFNNCWQAIEDILIVFLRTGLPHHAGVDIAEIPVEKRNPEFPKRFQFVSTCPIA